MTMSNECLLLVDGNSMLFRAYYATAYTNMMKTSSGIYTNAVYAFAVMLKKAIATLNPQYVAVCFDKGKHTFRHELAKDYKGGRKETPEELIMQFSIIRDYLKAYPIPYFEYDDLEADDLIGSLASRFSDIDICILSSDRDLLQLINDRVTVYLMKKGLTEMAKMDEKALFEEYELTPKQIIDLKSLMGDHSDNIKGVRNIGPKTAIKLLKQYNNIENLYDHLDEIKGKTHDYLELDKDQCFLSKQLATIVTDIKLDVSLKDLTLKSNTETLNHFYHEYEMTSLLNQKDNINTEVVYKKVDKLDPAFFEKGPFLYFAGEPFSYYRRQIDGMAISDGQKTEFITLDDLLNDDACLAFLNSDKPKLVYDLKAVKHLLDYHKIAFNAQNVDDLMIEAFLVYNYLDNYNAIFEYYGYSPLAEMGAFYGTVKKPLNPDIDKIAAFSCAFAANMAKIAAELYKDMQKKDVLALYEDVEKPLIMVLYAMEKAGICCDDRVLDAIAQETNQKMAELADNIFHDVGHEFNLNSPKQLAEVLFDELGLPDRKKRSTAVEVLEKLINYHPVVAQLMEYRKYSKLYSTYAEGLKKYIEEDGKIHTIFSQTITQTGRLSSYDPNLQNISVRDEDSKMIRKAFKPSEGHILMSSDYSQIELRVLASLADEEKMIAAFNEGIDIHAKTATDIFHIPLNEVDEHLRRKAKAINFGVVYGISDFGLSKQASLSIKEAKHFIEEYFKTYPKIKIFMDGQIAFCQEHGYVKTMLKRRRYIKEINDNNFMIKEFGKRAAMNSPIQGSAADLIKIAMVHIDKMIKEQGLRSKMILQVHDELIFDVEESEIKAMQKLIHDGMTNAYQLKVRLDASFAMGKTWYEAK